MRLGFAASSTSGASPISSSVPGRKFSMNTSAVLSSAFNACICGASRRFSTTERLLRP
jgi:hypothetical protein